MRVRYKYRYSWSARMGIRIKRLFRRIFKKKELEFDTPQQEKAVNITYRLIRDANSELLMAPLSEKLYIKNKNIFVVIGPRSINIINGKFNYDFAIYEKLYNKISMRFKRKLESKRIEMENVITNKVESILDVIYMDLNKSK